MKIGVKIINNLLKKPLSTEDMVWALEQTEVEVEEILYANKLDPKVIVAEIVKIEPHPNADKLKLVTVSTDAGKTRVVCGAPNVKNGLRVAFAQVGTILPDGMEIAQATIRGEDSAGMLCSEREIGWGDDHSGIVELNPRFPLGKSLCDIENYGDVLDIKTPSNRWDYLSYIGLAREIAAVSAGNSLVEPEIGEYAYKNREVANVKKKVGCKAFYSVKLRVKAPEHSPQWVVDNLQASGMRPINPVVDITNLVMLEYGQPSHAFDLGKLKGQLQVRNAKPGESLTTLDGKARKLTAEDPVIADDNGALDIAGVMGGEKTEIGPNTTEIYLTVANLDKTVVRRAALRHGMRTEASTRNEKGLPLPLPNLATKRLLDLLKEICDAEIIDGPFEQLFDHPKNPWLGLRVRKAERFLGCKLNEKEVSTGLVKRGFEPKHFSLTALTKEYLNRPYKYGAQAWSDGLDAFDCSYLTQTILGKAAVSIPRTAADQFDVGQDVAESDLKPGDLLFLTGKFTDQKEAKKHRNISHVGVYVGKNKVLQASSTAKKVTLSPLSLFTKAKDYKGAKRYFEGNLNHIISVEVPWWRNDISLEEDLFEEVAKIVGYDNIPGTLPQLPAMETAAHQLLPKLMDVRRLLVSAGLQEVWTYSFVSQKDLEQTSLDLSGHLQIENPLSSEQDFLRSNLMASHLHVVTNNQVTHRSADIFELSRVYDKTGSDVKERWVLGLTSWGTNSLLRVKKGIDVLSQNYKLETSIKRAKLSNGEAGRSGEGFVGNSKIVTFGQIEVPVAHSFGAKVEVSHATIEITDVIALAQAPKILAPLPYQQIERDFTIQVDDLVLWQDVQNVLMQQKNTFEVEFVGIFKNPELQKQHQQRLSVRVRYDLGPNPTQKQIDAEQKQSTKLLTNTKQLGEIKLI